MGPREAKSPLKRTNSSGVENRKINSIVFYHLPWPQEVCGSKHSRRIVLAYG